LVEDHEGENGHEIGSREDDESDGEMDEESCGLNGMAGDDSEVDEDRIDELEELVSMTRIIF
jgi:hypothetical protein